MGRKPLFVRCSIFRQRGAFHAQAVAFIVIVIFSGASTINATMNRNGILSAGWSIPWGF